MNARTIRGQTTGLPRGRVVATVGAALLAGALAASPAAASGFGDLADNIVGKATEVATVFRAILFGAAVISLFVGAAPMLWGEVRVKWMVSALVACTVIGLMGSLVNTMTGSDSGSSVLADTSKK